MTDSPHRGREEQSGFREGPDPTQPLGNAYPGTPIRHMRARPPTAPPIRPPPRRPRPSSSGVLAVRLRPLRDRASTANTAGSIRPQDRANRRRMSRSRPAGCGCWPRSAVLAVIGLVIALVIVYDSSRVRRRSSRRRRRCRSPAPRHRTPTTTSRTPTRSGVPASDPAVGAADTPARPHPAPRRPWSTTSAVTAGPSTSPTSTTADCCRRSSTSCCRGARKSNCQSPQTIPRASASSTSAAK